MAFKGTIAPFTVKEYRHKDRKVLCSNSLEFSFKSGSIWLISRALKHVVNGIKRCFKKCESKQSNAKQSGKNEMRPYWDRSGVCADVKVVCCLYRAGRETL
jgi:hypothetical protein